MKRIKKVLAVLMCMALVLGMTGCKKRELSPENAVKEAFDSMFDAKTANIAEEMGIQGVFDNMSENAYESGIKIKLEDTDIPDLSSLKSAAIQLKQAMDPKNSKGSFDLAVDMGLLQLTALQLYVDSNQIAVASPALINKVFFADFSGDFKSKLKSASVWQLLGESVDVDEIISSVEGVLNDNGSAGFDTEMADKLVDNFDKKTNAITEFKKSVEYVKSDSKSLEINGKEKDCQGYEVVVSSEAVIDFALAAAEYSLTSEDAKAFWDSFILGMEATNAEQAEYFSDALEEMKAGFAQNKEEIKASVKEVFKEVKINVYLYDNQVASAEFELILNGGPETGEVKIAIELNCTGGKNCIYDSWDLTIDATDLDVPKITARKSFNSDKKAVSDSVEVSVAGICNISYDFDYNKSDKALNVAVNIVASGTKVDFKVKGSFDDIEANKSFTLTVDEVSLKVDEATIIKLSGEVYVKDKAKITMPEGTKFDVLTPNITDWVNILTELQGFFGDSIG